MTVKTSLRGKVEIGTHFRVPRRISEIESWRSRRDPRSIAEGAIRRVASDLGVSRSLAGLRFDCVRESTLERRALYQQEHHGRPISGAWIRVDIDHEGRLRNIENDLIPEEALPATPHAGVAMAATASALTEAEAADVAVTSCRRRASRDYEVSPGEQVYFLRGAEVVPAWKLTLRSRRRPREVWKVYVDEENGEILETTDLLRRATGQARVFDPHPVAVLDDTTLREDSTIPEVAYSTVELRDLEDTGFLDGPFVSTRLTRNRVQQMTFQYNFSRSRRAFKEVMAYFHIDRAQRRIQSLGFRQVMNKQIAVDVTGTDRDQSFYDSDRKTLTFGIGGVDDAEDAEIILHEYAHAIQDDIVPGFGPRGEARAMGEGFGDYLAASFFADRKPARLRACVGSWDAVPSSQADPPCLRRVDSNKMYPADFVAGEGREHTNGEIWSSCLWELRDALGARRADQLIIVHNFIIRGRDASFADTAKAMLLSNRELTGGRNQAVIRETFVRRGILS